MAMGTGMNYIFSCSMLSFSTATLLCMSFFAVFFHPFRSKPASRWVWVMVLTAWASSLAFVITPQAPAHPIHQAIADAIGYSCLLLMIHSTYGFSLSYASLNPGPYFRIVGWFHIAVAVCLWAETWLGGGMGRLPYLKTGICGAIENSEITAALLMGYTPLALGFLLYWWLRSGIARLRETGIFSAGLLIWLLTAVHDFGMVPGWRMSIMTLPAGFVSVSICGLILCGLKYHPGPEIYPACSEQIASGTVLEGLDIGLIVIDANGAVSHVNTKAQSLCRLSRDQALGKPLTEIIRFADQGSYDYVKNLARDIIKTTDQTEAEKTITLEVSGQCRLVREMHYRIVDSHQAVIGLAILLKDGSRGKIHPETDAGDDSFRRAFETAGTAMVVFEDDMTISMVNTEFEALTQFPRHEIEDKKCWSDFILHDERDHMEKYLLDRRRHPERPAAQQSFRLIDKAGRVLTVLTKINIFSDSGRAVASLINITERKQAEELLRQSETCYRSLVESTMDVFFISELPTGRFLILNQMFCDLYGYLMDEALRMTVWDLICPEDHKMIQRDIDRWLSRESIEDDHSVINTLRKDGSTLRVDILKSVVKFQGKMVFQGLIKDVTEREQLQRQLAESQKMNAIGTLAGGIAHDFNNLMMGIQGYTTLMLLDISPSHPHYKRLKSIEHHVEKGANLTRQILDFAQTKKQELKLSDLNLLIKKSLYMFGRSRKEINIHTTYQHGIWPANIDTGQIEQVLLNLYLNAWQAMPDGGDLYVQTRNVSFSSHQTGPIGLRPGDYVKISVRDTGTGILKDHLPKIFDPFFTTKPVGTGSGLGLASCYGIIRTHGGLIEAQSESGQGAVFTIYLPAHKAETVSGSLPTEAPSPKTSKTVLIVDDESHIIDVGSQLLKKLGYQVLTATTGTEAVTIYKSLRHRIDLVILDVVMPTMGGRETYIQLKEVDPDVKVLLSSGYTRSSLIEDMLKNGCRGFVQKPFKFEYLDEQIRHILSES